MARAANGQLPCCSVGLLGKAIRSQHPTTGQGFSCSYIAGCLLPKSSLPPSTLSGTCQMRCWEDPPFTKNMWKTLLCCILLWLPRYLSSKMNFSLQNLPSPQDRRPDSCLLPSAVCPSSAPWVLVLLITRLWQRLTFQRSLVMQNPSRNTSPEVAVSSPVSIWKVVVFPAPLNPSSPKQSPRWIAMEMFLTARMTGHLK